MKSQNKELKIELQKLKDLVDQKDELLKNHIRSEHILEFDSNAERGSALSHRGSMD